LLGAGTVLAAPAQASPPGGLAGSRTAGAGAALSVIPFPGTPDASPTSQIIFPALRPSDLRAVTVTGSRSGGHRGRVVALVAGTGASFMPKSPFTPGESVRVRAVLSSPKAGTASGDPGATRLSFSFRVGGAPGPPPDRPLDRRVSNAPTQHFRSAPDLRPPVISPFSDRDRQSGDIFLAAQGSPQVGPLILDSQGRLVWFHPLARGSASYISTDLEMQRYQGRPVLTWWQGNELGYSHDVIMDRSYRTIATVHAQDGYQPDLHEFQITQQGTALFAALAFEHTNLTSVGGPANGQVIDQVIQEIDIKTGRLLWEWHALGHVPVDASYQPYVKNQPYDFFHLNSIQQLPGGNLLVSARNTWAVYEISRQTGRLIWTLGGKHSDFTMGTGSAFEWQHDARLHAGDVLSLFDDGFGGAGPSEGQSSAEMLHLEPALKKASLIHRFTHSPPLLTAVAGSTEALANGDIFVGWGAQPEFSEYTPNGRLIFNASFARGVGSYRAFRFPWVGKPRTRPALAVSTRGRTTVYASWNGATQVTAWRVLGGSNEGHLKSLGVTAPRSGFETAIHLARAPRYLAVQALGSGGRVLGSSAAVRR
jgi:hypothetical protein